MQDRVAIVTGGATGIGAAIAKTLAIEGCKVWIFDRDSDQAKRTAAECGIEASAVDVTDAASVDRAVARSGSAWPFRYPRLQRRHS
ncbi:MAG: SDR family NAD(P)-dependent oxidoreductase [Methylobacteriaceae bacterium]|nr:SDR family NAD(P)-dependent oxidoreductase [Methylobacteriaceae bacterium]